MKLFQYCRGTEIRTGIVINDLHCDLKETVEASGLSLPCTLDDLLKRGTHELADRLSSMKPVVLKEPVRFAPAVADPDKILCIGLNYAAHQNETNLHNNAKFPPLFCKFRNSLAAHEQPIRLPAAAERFDYEVELVVILGKIASQVTPEEAADCIFGYTVGNDFSARDLQMATSQWLMGKACDDFAPIGPYIVTKDSLDVSDLSVTTRVNGVLRQDGRTSDMIFSCCQIISHISKVMTLVPGDVIYTGTPSGVILGYPEADRVWLKAGDTVEVSVEGIGTLRNTLIGS